MPTESESSGPTEPLIVEADDVDALELNVSGDDLSTHFTEESVSISLKYFMKSCECFSEWQQKELKKFSATLEKISGYSAELLRKAKPLCDSHKGGPSENRFKRPSSLSDDLLFYELKIDPSNKARVHGFFVGSVFFLVWLDRKHACFPS